MKNSYLYSTWAATCVASTGGSIYTAIVFILTSKGPIDYLFVFTLFFFAAIIISLPVLTAGSVLIGWWITKILIRRTHTNRIYSFTMVGALMGFVATLAIIAGICIISQPRLVFPRAFTTWIDTALVSSIPIVYLTLAGFVAGVHAIRSEQAAPSNR